MKETENKQNRRNNKANTQWLQRNVYDDFDEKNLNNHLINVWLESLIKNDHSLAEDSMTD